MGMPVLVSLCLIAFLGAVALATRAWNESRSERALVVAALWLALVLLPIHVLGWLGAIGVPPALDRPKLAVAIGIASLGSLAVGLGRRVLHAEHRGAALRELGETLLDLVRLPLDGLALTARAHSLALVGLVSVFVIVLWTAWGSWLAPSSAWDGVFYHEAMIGFAIQNKGFALDPLPSGLAPIAGYPRMAESLSLFFVMFLDRRLIEFPGSPMLLVITLASYVMLRRWLPTRASAIGFATGLALVPGIVLQLRSTYIDTVAAGFFVIGLAFATRRELRMRDALLASIAIGMVGASKSTGFLLAPMMTLVLVGRVAVHVHGRARAAWAIAGAMAIVLAICAPTYVRNWIQYDNPLWPGRVHVPLLGIDWEGPLDVAAHQRGFRETIATLFAPPIPGQQYHDTRDNGYGNVPPFLILPLGLLAILVALKDVVTKQGRVRDFALGMLITVVPIFATFALSPAKYWARLNLHAVVAIWLAAAWLSARARGALSEGVIGAVVVGGLLTLWWSEPAWDIPPARIERLAMLSTEERALASDGMITLAPTDLAREREQLRDGELVVFADHPFPAQLWNERFSNRVVWLAPSTPDWIATAEAMGASWVIVPRSGALITHLRADEQWEELGPAVLPEDVFAFRRHPRL